MPALATPVPARRPDLVVRPIGDAGHHVVKIPGSHDYFHLGESEHFLLEQLDGRQNVEAVQEAFRNQFGEELSEEDLDSFVEITREQGLLKSADGETESISSPARSRSATSAFDDSRQSIFYFRKNVFDPDRLFNWLEPWIRFFWTRAFLLFSAGCIACAVLLLWTGRTQAVSSFSAALRWETALLAWLTVFVVGVLHEFAHGLTCKHHGGEVREIGFLMMFFIPCFYCNVSDAWLFREKSKRLWVTFAGAYFEFFLWALAVFVWRITVPDTLINYLAFIVLTVSGIDSFFNFNPLLKLDGYYLVSDWFEIPNLRERSIERFQAQTRRFLWGGASPDQEPRGRVLTVFGMISWGFTIVFLGGFCLALLRWSAQSGWGLPAMVCVGALTVYATRRMSLGFFMGEVGAMLKSRHTRAAGWIGGAGLLIAIAFLIEIDDRATGPFTLRAERTLQIQAPVDGVLRQICAEEGECVEEGVVLFRLEVPDLEARLARKRAERDAAAAELAILEAGTREEELVAQHQRVQRASLARDLAVRHLEECRAAHLAEAERLRHQIDLAHVELRVAEAALERAQELRNQNALSAASFEKAESERDVNRARLRQAEADQRVHAARGFAEAEQDLDELERAFAEAASALALMKAGTRRETIAAQQARVRQLDADINELEMIQSRQTITAPDTGCIVTPHLAERIGQYVTRGETICELAETSIMTAEVTLTEDDVSRVSVGQPVHLVPRSLRTGTVRTCVQRIAPVGITDSKQNALPSRVTVSCRLENDGRLRAGTTGHARINTGRRSIAAITFERARHFVRTEFWW